MASGAVSANALGPQTVAGVRQREQVTWAEGQVALS